MIAITMAVILLVSRVQLISAGTSSMFVGEMSDVTVATGREAVFTCVVDNVENFKVAFLRVDTQTILTIDETIITRSARVTVRYHIDKDDRLSTRQRKTWQLSLKEVTAADAGAYMCQLNIEPMVSQVAYLHVTVPPDILVNESSSDLTVTEGENATLKCSAIGYPQPNITWRREDYQPIYINQSGVEGPVLNIASARRRQMAAYLCIASNGIPPPVSKRILLRVEFPPDVTSHQTYIVQRIGEPLMLHCQCQSWPLGMTYWTHNSSRLSTDNKALTDYRTQAGSPVMDVYLNMPEMKTQDQGDYTCYCANIHGMANWTISVKGIEVSPAQQRRMAHSWSTKHREEEEEEEEETDELEENDDEGEEDDEDEENVNDEDDDFSSVSPMTTAATIRQTEKLLRTSTTDLTTSKTIEANQPTEGQKGSSRSWLQQQRKESSAGVPTSFTSMAPAWSFNRCLYFLPFIIFLIDNHPAV